MAERSSTGGLKFESPLDNFVEVEDLSALDDYVSNDPMVFEGQLIYVQSKKKYYAVKDTTNGTYTVLTESDTTSGGDTTETSFERVSVERGRAASNIASTTDPEDMVRLTDSTDPDQLSRLYWDTNGNLRWLVAKGDLYMHPEGGGGDGTVFMQTDLQVGDPDQPDQGGEIRHTGRINAYYDPVSEEPAVWLGKSYDGDETYNQTTADYIGINPPDGTSFDNFLRLRSEGEDRFVVGKEGDLVASSVTADEISAPGESGDLLYNDGGVLSPIGPSSSYSTQSVDVEAGQVVRFAYEKDGSYSAGKDRAWIDEIRLPDGSVVDFSGGLPDAITNGSPGWEVVNGTARSVDIKDDQSATMELTANQAGTVEFDYDVSSEDELDFFVVYVDGAQQFEVSGMYESYVGYDENTGLNVQPVRLNQAAHGAATESWTQEVWTHDRPDNVLEDWRDNIYVSGAWNETTLKAPWWIDQAANVKGTNVNPTYIGAYVNNVTNVGSVVGSDLYISTYTNWTDKLTVERVTGYEAQLDLERVEVTDHVAGVEVNFSLPTDTADRVKTPELTAYRISDSSYDATDISAMYGINDKIGLHSRLGTLSLGTDVADTAAPGATLIVQAQAGQTDPLASFRGSSGNAQVTIGADGSFHLDGESHSFGFDVDENAGDLVLTDSNGLELIRQPEGGATQFIQGIDVGYPFDLPSDQLTTFANAPVTSAPSAGTEVGYTLAVDNQTVAKVNAEADGSGGIQSRSFALPSSNYNRGITFAPDENVVVSVPNLSNDNLNGLVSQDLFKISAEIGANYTIMLRSGSSNYFKLDDSNGFQFNGANLDYQSGAMTISATSGQTDPVLKLQNSSGTTFFSSKKSNTYLQGDNVTLEGGHRQHKLLFSQGSYGEQRVNVRGNGGADGYIQFQSEGSNLARLGYTDGTDASHKSFQLNEPGAGLILRSPDGSATPKLTATNDGGFSLSQMVFASGQAGSDMASTADPNDLIRFENTANAGQISRFYWDTQDNLRWLVSSGDIYIHPEGGDGSGTVHLQTDLMVGDPDNPDAGGEIRHTGRINAKYNPESGQPAEWLGTSYDGDNTYNPASLDYMAINPPDGTTFDNFQRFRSEGKDRFVVSKDGEVKANGGLTLTGDEGVGNDGLHLSGGIGVYSEANSGGNRYMVRPTDTDRGLWFFALPSGNAAQSEFQMSNASTPDTRGRLMLRVDGSDGYLVSDTNGSGTDVSKLTIGDNSGELDTIALEMNSHRGVVYDGSSFTVAGRSGQTAPILELNDNAGTGLLTFTPDGELSSDHQNLTVRTRNNHNLNFIASGTNSRLSIQAKNGIEARLNDHTDSEAFEVLDDSGTRLLRVFGDGRSIELGAATNDLTDQRVLKIQDGFTGFDGRPLRIAAGSGDTNNSGTTGGSIFIHGGEAGTDGDVILGHNGSTQIGYVGVGTTSPGATITARAKLSQTDPLLQLQDETGSAIVTAEDQGTKKTFTVAHPTGGTAVSAFAKSEDSQLRLIGPDGRWQFSQDDYKPETSESNFFRINTNMYDYGNGWASPFAMDPATGSTQIGADLGGMSLNAVGGRDATFGGVDAEARLHVFDGAQAYPMLRADGATHLRTLVAGDGYVSLGEDVDEAMLNVIPPTSAKRGLLVRGASGQTAPLLQLEDSAETAHLTYALGEGLTGRDNEFIRAYESSSNIDLSELSAGRLLLDRETEKLKLVAESGSQKYTIGFDMNQPFENSSDIDSLFSLSGEVQDELRYAQIKKISSDYTITATDAGKTLHVDTTENSVFITIPTGMTQSIEVVVKNVGSGTVSFAAESGVTLNTPDGRLDITKQYGGALIYHDSDDVWFGEGRLV